jgi:hypothetical protein
MLVDRARMLMLSLASISYEIYDPLAGIGAEPAVNLADVRDDAVEVVPELGTVLAVMLGSPSADNVFVPKANAGPDEIVDGMLVDRARMLMLCGNAG